MHDIIYIAVGGFLLFGVIMLGHSFMSNPEFNVSEKSKKTAQIYAFVLAIIVSCIIRYSFSLILGDVDESNEKLFEALYELEEVKDRMTALNDISKEIKAIDTYYNEEEYDLNAINYEIASEINSVKDDTLEEIDKLIDNVFYDNSSLMEKYEEYYKNKKGR